MPTRRTFSRRGFLKTAAVAAPYIIPGAALGKEGRPAPSNRLTLGLIGLGSMGMRHVKGFLVEDDCQITAVCDLDGKRLAQGAKEINEHYGNTDCATYHDFRDLIARDDIDTLCIAVPGGAALLASRAEAVEAMVASEAICGISPV